MNVWRAHCLRFVSIVLALVLPGAVIGADMDIETILTEWAKSAHAQKDAPSFTHWNEEGEIPADCAVCHAGAGFRRFHGLGGGPKGVRRPQPVGGVVDCETCHAPGARAISTVTFPSGATVPVSPGEGPCFTCHQGRVSGPGLQQMLAGIGEDTIDPSLGFVNPHYKAAAASLLGTVAQGMFEYDSQPYAGRFEHAAGLQNCTGCHEPHGLEVRREICAQCHAAGELSAIRRSVADHDGDGDVSQGIQSEIQTLTTVLLEEIEDYARNRLGAPLVYAADSYPYFFTDGDGDGRVGAGEAVYPNRFASWTPRLLRAAYNFQFVMKDPGAYAHNPRYTLQVLIDTIVDLAPERAARFTRP